MLGAAPAFADEIGDAAKRLSNVAYPFLKDVDWNSVIALKKPGSAPAVEWAKAVGKTIDMGAAMDPTLLKAGVEAHHKALGPVMRSGGLITKNDFEGIIAAIGRMIASVPESKTMDVYNALSKLVDPKVPAYLMSSVKEANAKAAYAGLMDFKDVVKAHPITPAAVAASAPNGQIAAAAKTLSAKAYPFLKDIDWTSDLFLNNPGYTGPLQVLKAVDRALVMGAAMDPAALREAAQAHVTAIGNVDAKGLATLADFEAINAGLGKAIASVPTSKVMDVYLGFAGITNPDVPTYLLSKVKAEDAKAAYAALLEFKDVVKAAR
jgi:hypothetical protein